MSNPNRQFAHTTLLATWVGALLLAGDAHASGDQLVLLPEVGKLLALIILFTALVFPLNALIFQPIFRVLDAREEKTAGTRKRADQLAAEVEAMLERYESSVREVRHDAEEARKQTLAGAREEGGAATTASRGEAETEVTRAREEVAAALDRARETLKEQSAVLANEVAERALGRPLS